MTRTADVVICGAGISGLATAYHLVVQHGVRNIVIVDERPPLSLTSDKSTEAYRNWWPDEAMVQLMNRSIDWLERWAHESGNRFLLNRRGYVYFTADERRVDHFRQAAQAVSMLGAGPLREHVAGASTYAPISPHDFEGQPAGADLVLDRSVLAQRFPYVNEGVVAALHPRRCGWFSGQQLGMYLLEQAKSCGVTMIDDRVTGVDVQADRVEKIRLRSGLEINTRAFVNAAGPFVNDVARLMNVELPVFNELHLKVAIKDYLSVVPRDAPLLIWTDPQYLPWSEEERSDLAQSEDTRWLLNEFPGGVHARPEGGADSNIVLLLWAYHVEPMEVMVPPPLDEFYPEVVVRGMATMLPGLRAYFGKVPVALYDGGYYTKTRENRLLACPLPIAGAFVCGAVSGYGLMAAAAAGELTAAHVTGAALPAYAADFDLRRYASAAYQRRLQDWSTAGQL